MAMRILQLAALLSLTGPSLLAADRPNIIWLFAEDTSPWMGCYGDPVNAGHTPNIDALAKNGVLFARAFVPAPVCSACRSALMGGQNQMRFNAHEHRSSRGPAKLHLPRKLKLLPQIMKESGYFTFNCGKDDYNFVWDQKATHSYQNRSRENIPWEDLKKNQPFFGQIQTAGGKNNTKNFPAERKADPAEVTVPPDYPQNQLYREVVAQHYDAIRKDDDFIGGVMEKLESAGLANNTVVVYFGDHGANNLVRHKQMPTEGGLHVPFIISGPDPWVPATSVREDLVNLLDLSATTLAWAGVKIPNWYEGQDLFGFKVVPRPYVAAAKDRLDHTIDRVRTVRSDQFRYTRNYKTDRIFLQPQYRDSKDYVINLRELYAAGKLDDKLTEIYFGERPAEEFYDVKSDPSQINNLIDDPKYQAEIELHREYLAQWLAKGDAGEGEESKEELEYQARDHKWGRAVNPEYEIVRSDSDGDGLSDKWEEINNRDPADGKINYLFDCGGWQTEGWEATSDSTENIAGRLGFLDFHLNEGTVTLRREGLSLKRENNGKHLALRVRTTGNVVLNASVEMERKTHKLDRAEMSLSAGFNTVKIPMPEFPGLIKAVDLMFEGATDTLVEIDSITVE